MWIEIKNIEDMIKIALLSNQFGCTTNTTGEIIRNSIERKVDCHFYYYKSDKMELIKGYKQNGDIISLIVYVIKAESEDYHEAIRLMGENAKEHLNTRKIKTITFGHGTEDVDVMDSHNLGVRKIGYIEFMNIVKEEYEKIGFEITISEREIKKVLR